MMMRALFILLVAGGFAACGPALAQSPSGQPSDRAAGGADSAPQRPGPTLKSPVDPGTQKSPDSSMSGPSNSGVIVVPPRTGTENTVTPPKNVDPGMDDATRNIDRQNREKSEEKAGGKS